MQPTPSPVLAFIRIKSSARYLACCAREEALTQAWLTTLAASDEAEDRELAAFLRAKDAE